MTTNDVLKECPKDKGYRRTDELCWFAGRNGPLSEECLVLAQRMESVLQGVPDVWVAVPTVVLSSAGGDRQKETMNRYFVDERAGCIAVRDREQTDPEYPGLHPDTTGVVRYWHGTPQNDTCPTCGQRRPAGWEIADADRQSAVALCAELNQANAQREGRA